MQSLPCLESHQMLLLDHQQDFLCMCSLLGIHQFHNPCLYLQGYMLRFQTKCSSGTQGFIAFLRSHWQLSLFHFCFESNFLPSNVHLGAHEICFKCFGSFINFNELYLNELLFTPRITIFLPHSPIGNQNFELASNPFPLYTYLSGSAFLVNLTSPNKQSISAKFLLKSLDQVSKSQTINTFSSFLWVKVTLPYFKHLSLNSTAIFEL